MSTDRRRNRIEERGMDRKGGWSKGVLPTEETCVRAREAEVAERRRATGVCPMLSVVAMGMLLIGRRADRRHGSRGATPTIARPRTPTSTPPPSPDSPRQRAACNLSLPHPPRIYPSCVYHSHATPIPAPRVRPRPNTLDTRPSNNRVAASR